MRSVNDVMLMLKQIIKIGHSDVGGCCILSNGMMVLVNHCIGEVIVVHKDGSRDFTINVRSGHPFDVSCIDSNTIVVSTPNHQCGV